MTDGLLFRAQNVKKHFPVRSRGLFGRSPARAVKAVDGVSFCLYEGETLGVIGESGCGKSTLARLAMGLLEPTEGTLEFEGTPVGANMPLRMRRDVQMVFQDPYTSLDPRMSIRRILEEPLRVHERQSRTERDAKLPPLLEQVGLSADALDKFAHEFSGGQLQRIGIARALMSEPKLLICDEPVSALDVSIQAQVLNLFASLKKARRLTYLFISHDMGVIRHVSDRIIVMYLGRVVEVAAKDELFTHALHPYTRALISAIPVPDPRAKAREHRLLLSGELPSPIDTPPGCAFAPRCPRAEARCRSEAPALAEMAPRHSAACHLAKAGDDTW